MMKINNIILSAVFIICSFTSCKTNNINNMDNMNNNIVLTDFTKELISLFINEPGDYYQSKANDKKYEIIISTRTDSLNYYLSINYHNSKAYEYCDNNLVGDTSYLEQRVKVHGDKESIFYSVIDDIKYQKPCKIPITMIEYNPPTWTICLNKDLSFNKMKSEKVTLVGDKSSLQSLVEKHFKVSDATP